MNRHWLRSRLLWWRCPERPPNGLSCPTPSGLRFYHPQLLAQLKLEHIELQRLFRLTERSHRRGERERAVASLLAFLSLLRSHLRKENLHLYRYLQQAYLDDPAQGRMLQAVQQEMRALGRTLNAFASAYADPDRDTNGAEFAADLERIGAVLTRRISEEELRLYPLYRAPGAFAPGSSPAA